MNWDTNFGQFAIKLIKVMLLAFLFLMGKPVFAQVKWQTFDSKEPSFSVSMPGTVRLMEKGVSTPTGDFLLHTVYTESSVDSTGNFLYLVNYFEAEDIDFSPDSSFNAYIFLEDFLDNIKAQVDGTLLYSHRDQFDQNPVLEYRLNYRDDLLSMKGRILQVGQTIYSLQVFSDKKNSLNRNMDSFLHSFRLISRE